ncbi:hypothetical protein FRB95_014634 [Tulasnella sp. JGI-2019a]|nr:hypothetical protein FRB95_014634 [Tulasnella sp. JGI-2019a]
MLDTDSPHDHPLKHHINSNPDIATTAHLPIHPIYDNDAASTTAPSSDDGHDRGSGPGGREGEVEEGVVSPEVPPTLAEPDQDSAIASHHKSGLIGVDAIIGNQPSGYEDIHESLEHAMEAEADQEQQLESEAPVPEDMDTDMDMDIDDEEPNAAPAADDSATQSNGHDGSPIASPSAVVNGDEYAPMSAQSPEVVAATTSPTAYAMNQLDLSPKPQTDSPAAPSPPHTHDEPDDERPSKRARNSYEDPASPSSSHMSVVPTPITAPIPTHPAAPEAPTPPATIAPLPRQVSAISAAPLPPKPASPAPRRISSGPHTFSSAQHKFATGILRTLKKSKDILPFMTPVDPVALNIPHYPNVVKHPMDFGTIERKLSATKKGANDVSGGGAGGYKTVDDFTSDVRLVFENCYAFNGRQHIVAMMAERLQDVFERQVKHMPPAEDPTSAVAVVTPRVVTPVPAARLPSPVVAKPPKPLAAPRRQSTSASTAIKPDPGSLNVNSRPKREIHAPPPKELPYDNGASSSSKFSGVNGHVRGKKGMRDDGTADQLKFCHKIVTDLYKKQYQSFAYFFYDPVDASIVPNYYKVIKKPMDLSTMRKKLEAHEYNDASRFYADFQQLLKNCFTFNPEGSLVREAGMQLQRVFEEKWNALPPLKSDMEDEDEDDLEDEEDKSDAERESVIRSLELQVTQLNASIETLRAQGREKKKRRERAREERLASRKASKAYHHQQQSSSSKNNNLYNKSNSNGNSNSGVNKPRTSSISSSSYQPKTNGASSSKHHSNGKTKSSSGGAGSGTKKGKEVMTKEEEPAPPPAPGFDDLDSPLDNAQKKELSEAIEQLEGTKLEKVITIIQEGVPGIGNNSEEIELEIDALPAPVLTKLYNFVVRPLKPSHASAGGPSKLSYIKPVKKTGSGNTGRTGAAATGGVKRKSMDEVAEADKIRALEEKQRLLAGLAPSTGGPGAAAAVKPGPGMGAGADEVESVQSESEDGSDSDSDSD